MPISNTPHDALFEQVMGRKEKENERPDKLLRDIYSASASLEKWRIARMMRMEGHSLKEIESLTDLEAAQIEMPQKEYKKISGVIEKIIKEGLWADRLVIGLANLHKKGDPGRERMVNTLRSVHQDMIEAAKRGARLQIAYKMMSLHKTFFLDGIAKTTELSIQEVKCLLDVKRIRAMEKISTLARVVNKALQAQIDRITIAKMVDLDVSDLDDLITTKDNDEDVFDFSFLQKYQSNIANNQLPGEGS